MSYTKIQLQDDGDVLFHAIIQVGKELGKMDTPGGRALNTKLLSNFNEYDMDEMTSMFNEFQSFLVECVNEEEKLDVEHVVKNKLSDLTQIIMHES
tara:strand:- start:154 stop:441 length:288 start_codon:yes stop_codon:yes gene_type:complete